MRDFDFYLAEARRKTGASSNNKIAMLLGVSSGAVSQLAQGKALPTDETMIKLAKLAEIEPEEALLDLSIWRSASNAEVQQIWMNIAKKN